MGKFLSVDPLSNEYPWYTPYSFAGNKPIWNLDLDGLEDYEYNLVHAKNSEGTPVLNFEFAKRGEKDNWFERKIKQLNEIPDRHILRYNGEQVGVFYSEAEMKLVSHGRTVDELRKIESDRLLKGALVVAVLHTYETVTAPRAATGVRSIRAAAMATEEEALAARSSGSLAAKGNITQAKTPTVLVGQTELNVYRGGGDFTIMSRDIKINPETGLVKTTHGLSVHTNAINTDKFGGAFKIVSIPSELKLVQRGKDVNHFEIVPTKEMSKEAFQNYLNQIKTVKINTTPTTSTNGN